MEAWRARFNRGVDRDAYLGEGDYRRNEQSLAVDPAGNIYVADAAHDGGSTWNFLVAKYGPDGAVLWSALIDSPSAGAQQDWPTALALDPFGNVYVTGYSSGNPGGTDLLTVKLNSLGLQQWAALHNGVGNPGEFGRAIAVDAAGNVFVAGERSGNANDYLIVKYDPSGVQQWSATFDGPTHGDERLFGLAVDGSGSPCVTGWSRDAVSGVSDFMTVRWSAAGAQLWAVPFDNPAPGSQEDFAYGLAVDASGNAYVVGGSNFQFMVVKYDPAGAQQWATSFAGVSTGEASAVAVIAGGDVVVTGTGTGGSSGWDLLTVQYDPAGLQQWAATSENPEPGAQQDYAYAIAVDGLGQVYVAGETRDPSTSRYDYLTAKYDAAGVEQWVRAFDSPLAGAQYEVGYAVGVDGSGNVLTGGISSGSTPDARLVKYDAAGTQLWTAIEPPSGATTDKVASETNQFARGGVAVDSAGRVSVTGLANDASNFNDFMTVRYGPNGVQMWAAAFENPAAGFQHDQAVAVAVDGDGNTYVTGQSFNGANWDYMTVKYDAAGLQQWATLYNGAANQNDVPSAIAVDAVGNVYVTGESHGGGTNLDYLTVKYNSSGTQVWEARFNGAGNYEDNPFAIFVDVTGNVYVTGRGYMATTGWDAVTVKYSPVGSQLWVSAHAGGYNYDIGYAVSADAVGNVYVSGYVQIDSSTGDALTVKYDSSGVQQWARTWENPAAAVQHDMTFSHALDASGNLYATGFSGNVGTGLFDYLTLKYDASGTLEWAQMFDNPAAGSQDDTAYSIALDGLGSVYVVGRSHNGSNHDLVTVRYDSAGTQQWTGTIDNGGQDYGTAMAVGANGAIVVAGTSDGLGQDYVVAKYVAAEPNAPSDPTLDSITPAAGAWTNDNTVQVTWSGATDAGGSGLAGYSISWDHASGTTPDTVVDIPHTADPHSATSAALAPDGNDWYFHLRTCDLAGNCTATVHAGPFWIDTTAPGAVAGLHSTSHWIGVPSPTTQVDLAFAASSDGLSGVDGYAVAVDGSPSWVCDGMKDLEESTLASFEVVVAGTWYAHVCALDNAGNAGAVTTSGPYVVGPPGSDPVIFWTSYGSGMVGNASADGSAVNVLVSVPGGALGVQVDPAGEDLYWAETGSNQIRRGALDGSGPVSLVSYYRPRNLALDLVHGHIYWTAELSNQITRANLDGTGQIDYLPAPGNNPWGLALDLAGGKIYWSEYSGQIRRGNLDGTGIESLTASGGTRVGLALDRPRGKVYWAEEQDGTIHRTNLDGSGHAVVVTGQSGVRGIEIDELNQKLYWVVMTANLVRRSNLDGTSIETVFTTPGTLPHALALWHGDTTAPSDPTMDSTSPAASSWTNDNTVEVTWSGAADNLGGSGLAGYSVEWNHSAVSTPDAVIDIPHTSDPHATTSAALAPDGNDWYFHLRTCDLAGNCTATVHAGPFWIDTTAPGVPGLVTSGTHMLGVPTALDQIAFSWSAAGDTLSGIAGYRFVVDPSATGNCAGGTPTAGLSGSSGQLADGVWYAHVCAVDEAGNVGAESHGGPWIVDADQNALSIYWTSIVNGDRVGVGQSDGTAVTTLVLEPSNVQPHELDIDRVAGKLYWSDLNAGWLRRSNLDGSAVETVLSGLQHPHGIAVDAVNGKLYWFERSIGVLRKANLDGSSVETLVTGRSAPRHLAVDAGIGKLYWTELGSGGNGAVVRANLDGSGVEVVANGLAQPHGIQIDAGHGAIYWTLYTGSIHRAALDGSSPTVLLSGISQPSEIGIDHATAKLYWVEGSGEAIRRANLDGSGAELVIQLPGLGIGMTLHRTDGTSPTDPAIDSTSPSANSWSSDNIVEVTWSGAADAGSGLAGYSIEWNHAVMSTPDATFDIPHTADPHSTPSAPLADGNDWYFHLRTCDLAGNCAAGVHAGPIWIDTTAPSAPGTVSSISHGDGLPKSNPTIDISWGPASDGLSGVAVYRYGFTATATPPACSGLGATTATLAGSSGNLADGTWYAHVCAVDGAGNLGAVTAGGPYVVDTTPPTGLVVSSSSHTVSTWSNDVSIEFAFSGATDASGVAGYAVVFDTAAGTVPACAATQAGQSFTGMASPDGSGWRLHVRAVDAAGNCGGTVEIGPFWIDTTAPPAPGTVVSTSHDGGATNDPTIDVEWGPSSAGAGAPITGYRFDFWSGAVPPACSALTGNSTGTSASSPVLGEGVWYLSVCALDGAGNESLVTTGGPYTIDTSGPTGLVVASTSHTLATWSSAGDVDFAFSGAIDPNGVAGYSIAFDQAAATVPDTTPEQAGTTFTGTASPDGADWYLHVRACDSAGNCSTAAHAGPYWIDTGAPSATGAVTSASHGDSEPHSDPTVAIAWGAASDALSGVAFYRYDFTALAGAPECATLVASTPDLTGVSGSLVDGNWYAHVCAVDTAGNSGAVVSGGPYRIDTAPPTVEAFDSVARTADLALTESEVVDQPLTQVYVSFAEEMFDPPGDATPGDVTNPANWLLVASGPNGLVDTDGCAVAGDDVELSLTLTWSAATRTAHLAPGGNQALAADSYLIAACGTLLDQAGNPLDGDGNGTGGDARARAFAVRGTDLAGNPNFDAGLAGWTVVATVPGEVAADLDDAGEQPTSGSVAVTSSAGAGETWQVEQCVPLPTHGWSRLSGRLRSASTLPGVPVARLEAQYFGAADCSSGALSALLTPAVVGDTGAVWVTVASAGAPFPAGAHSASVRLIVEAGATNDVDLRADELFFGDDGLLFADGFESGGTGSWSWTVP